MFAVYSFVDSGAPLGVLMLESNSVCRVTDCFEKLGDIGDSTLGEQLNVSCPNFIGIATFIPNGGVMLGTHV